MQTVLVLQDPLVVLKDFCEQPPCQGKVGYRYYQAVPVGGTEGCKVTGRSTVGGSHSNVSRPTDSNSIATSYPHGEHVVLFGLRIQTLIRLRTRPSVRSNHH